MAFVGSGFVEEVSWELPGEDVLDLGEVCGLEEEGYGRIWKVLL